MDKETSKEFFESGLGLGPDLQVSEVTLNETSDQVILDLSTRTGAKVACPDYGKSCVIYDCTPSYPGRCAVTEWRG